MPAQLEGTIRDTAIPRGAAGEAPTCRKPLLDEGEAVAGADELDVAAGQGAPLAGELDGQGGRGARPFRELESGQQGPHTCDLKVPHETLTSPERHTLRIPSEGKEMLKARRAKPTPMVVPKSAASPTRGEEKKANPLILHPPGRFQLFRHPGDTKQLSCVGDIWRSDP